jgi:hypothetical protein
MDMLGGMSQDAGTLSAVKINLREPGSPGAQHMSSLPQYVVMNDF